MMKTKILIGIAALATIGLTACDESAKLAGEVEGTWTAPKTEMASVRKDHKENTDKEGKDHRGGRPDGKPDMKPTLSCAPTITFVRTQGTNGGTLTISANYEVTQGVNVTDTVLTVPVKATVSGTVTADGTWQAKDDDEIVVTLDASKTSVTVDPASLALSYATLTDASASGLETLKEKVAGNISSAVVPMLQHRIGQLRKFDDVRIAGNTMTMEIGKTKLNFSKK